MNDCKLCKSINTGQLHNGRCIVKLDNNTYELQIWDAVPSEEFDYIYELFATTEIKCCPDCGNRLCDIPLEEIDWSVRTYHCLKNAGINFINQLKALKYDNLIQVRNLTQASIVEIQQVLKKY